MTQRPSLQEFLREVGDIEPVDQTQSDPVPFRFEPVQACTHEQVVNIFLWIAKFLGTNRVTQYCTQENIDKIERMSALAIGINAMYVFEVPLVCNIVNKLIDYCDVFGFTPPGEKFTKSTEAMKWLVSEITKQTQTQTCDQTQSVIQWAEELKLDKSLDTYMKYYLERIIDFHTKFPTVQFEQFLVTKKEFTQQILNYSHNLKLLGHLPNSLGIDSNYLKIRVNPLFKIIRIPEDMITDDPELTSVLFDDLVHEHNLIQEHTSLLKKLRWNQDQIDTVSSRWDAVNSVLKHIQDCLGLGAKNYSDMFNQAFLHSESSRLVRNDFVNIMYLHMAQQEVQRCHDEYLADINKITTAKQKSKLLQKYLCRDLTGMLVEYLL